MPFKFNSSRYVKGASGGAKGRTLSDAMSFIDKRRADYYAPAIKGKQRAMSSGGQAVLENLARAATPASISARLVDGAGGILGGGGGGGGDGSVAVAIPLLTPATSMQDMSAGGVKGGATRAESESQASVVMARELQKIDKFLSGAATDLSTAGLTIAHHVRTPGGGSLGFVADALAWIGRREVMQNYWVRRGLAALGVVLLIAFMVATTVVEKQEDV